MLISCEGRWAEKQDQKKIQEFRARENAFWIDEKTSFARCFNDTQVATEADRRKEQDQKETQQRENSKRKQEFDTPYQCRAYNTMQLLEAYERQHEKK